MTDHPVQDALPFDEPDTAGAEFAAFSGADGAGARAEAQAGTDEFSWADGPVLGFDTETTGVNVRGDRLVTVGLVRRERLADVASQQVTTWLADPGVEIPAGATAIHGVSTEQARAQGRPAREVVDEVAGRLAAALRAGTPVVAFNAPYDLTLLDAELRRHGLATLEERLGGPVRPIIDPLTVDRGLNRYRRGKRTLDVLCTTFGVQVEVDMHRAENDAILTLDLLAAMARDPKLGRVPLSQLHENQTAWHRTWAEGFNDYLRRTGRTPDAETAWPLAPAR